MLPEEAHRFKHEVDAMSGAEPVTCHIMIEQRSRGLEARCDTLLFGDP